MSESAELKPESWLWHLLGLVNPAIVIAGNLVGGLWVASGVLYMLGLGPFLDVLFGRAAKAKPPRESGRPFEVLLYVHALVQSLHCSHYCIALPLTVQPGQLGLQH